MTAERDWDAERAIIEAHGGAERIALIAQSHLRLTRNPLIGGDCDPLAALWSMPAPVLAHGTQDDPVFFYGNRAALSIFEYAAQDFIRLPSRLSAEPLARAERARLMERVRDSGFISDYSGMRVSASGRRFHVDQATVWNLLDADGTIRGQAACLQASAPAQDQAAET